MLSFVERSGTDTCEAQIACETIGEYSVVCDGENDGTNTSLCDCYLADGTWWFVPDLVQGESPTSCATASKLCLSHYLE